MQVEFGINLRFLCTWASKRKLSAELTDARRGEQGKKFFLRAYG